MKVSKAIKKQIRLRRDQYRQWLEKDFQKIQDKQDIELINKLSQ